MMRMKMKMKMNMKMRMRMKIKQLHKKFMNNNNILNSYVLY